MFRLVALSYHDSNLLCPPRDTCAKSSQSSEVCISKRCVRLANLVDCKSDIWAALQEMPGNAHASVASSSVCFTQSSLIFVTLSDPVGLSGWHRLALAVADTQDVQNVLDVSLAWCNVNGDRTCPCSRCMDVTVL